ncbi:MAG: light-harvesting protein [Rhodocyclaceae bacterium]
MNQGKVWLVVKPSVGLPAFLGAVAVIAIYVHVTIFSNVPWAKDYWQGGKKAAAAKAAPAPAPAAPAAAK